MEFLGDCRITAPGKIYDTYAEFCEDDKNVPPSVKFTFERFYQSYWVPESYQNWNHLYTDSARVHSILYKCGHAILIHPQGYICTPLQGGMRPIWELK